VAKGYAAHVLTMFNQLFLRKHVQYYKDKKPHNVVVYLLMYNRLITSPHAI